MKGAVQGRHKNSRTKNSRNSRRPKFLIQPGAKNFKTAGGQKPKKQPGARKPKNIKTAGGQKHNKVNVNKVNVKDNGKASLPMCKAIVSFFR